MDETEQKCKSVGNNLTPTCTSLRLVSTSSPLRRRVKPTERDAQNEDISSPQLITAAAHEHTFVPYEFESRTATCTGWLDLGVTRRRQKTSPRSQPLEPQAPWKRGTQRSVEWPR